MSRIWLKMFIRKFQFIKIGVAKMEEISHGRAIDIAGKFLGNGKQSGLIHYVNDMAKNKAKSFIWFT